MKNVLLKKIASLVAKKEISLDPKIGFFYAVSYAFREILSFLRGLLKTGKVVKVYRGTTIRCPSQLRVGKGAKIGRYCELDCLSEEGLSIGNHSSIGSFSIIRVSGTLRWLGKFVQLGDNVVVGDFAHIGGAGGVTIGSDTIIGAYLSIHPENHVFTKLDIQIRSQGVSRIGVVIGENCWIGAKVTILDGAIIGNGCVIAAGAVVRGSFPDNVVLGGVPAKIIKWRDE